MSVTILCVDDEVNILNALRRSLYDQNYQLLVATEGEEALALLEKHPVSIVISDQCMPKLRGTQLLAQIKETRPEIVRILLSGHTSSEELVEAINVSEIYRFVAKPWHDDFLRKVVEHSVTYQAMLRQQASQPEMEKMMTVRNLLNHAVSQWQVPLMGISPEREKVLFFNTALPALLPSLACIREGLDLKSFMPPTLLQAVRLQMKSPTVEMLEPVSLDGIAIRPRVHPVAESGYVVVLEMQKTPLDKQNPHRHGGRQALTGERE